MILILLITIPLLIFIIILIINNNKVTELFRIHNVAIFGAKGKGKDLLTQLIIKKRNKPYYANISYGYKYKHINIGDINIDPNTYENFIKGNLTKIEKDDLREGTDIFISDAGIFLPSQYDTLLSKEYKSLPIYYALSRHLYSQNIHFNTQSLNRVWIKLREQADYYIQCRGVIKLPFIFLIKLTTYDNYESALLKLKPNKARLLNSYSKAENDIYSATNGEIKDMLVAIPQKWIKYDTRAFHEVVFKEKAPNQREIKQIERINKQ